MAYNPSIHTATNKPIGLTNKPVDARTYYYDSAAFAYRPYTSTAEVLAYLVNPTDRVGHFSVIIGTAEYWFKDGVADANLVLKGQMPSGGSAGDALVKSSNADYDTEWFDFDSLYLKLAGGIITGDVQTTFAAFNANSLITKNYVDNIITGVIWVGADVATTANITLSGEQTIDGVLTSASRVFVKNQTDQTKNGIYISGASTWARASDADTGAEIARLAVIIEGGTQKGNQWVNSNSSITLGTTNITFVQNAGLGTYTNGVGITLTGTAFGLDTSYTDARYLRLSGAAQIITQTPTFNNGITVNGGTGGITFTNPSMYFEAIGGNGFNLKNGTILHFSNTGGSSDYQIVNGNTSHYGTQGLNISEYPYGNGSINIVGSNIKDEAGVFFAKMTDIPSVTGFVPYSGATADISLGSHDLTATNVYGASLNLKNGGFVSNIIAPSLGTNHTVSVPDKSGTIAMISDIPSAGTYIQNQNTIPQVANWFMNGVATLGDNSFVPRTTNYRIGLVQTVDPTTATNEHAFASNINFAKNTSGFALASYDGWDRMGDGVSAINYDHHATFQDRTVVDIGTGMLNLLYGAFLTPNIITGTVKAAHGIYIKGPSIQVGGALIDSTGLTIQKMNGGSGRIRAIQTGDNISTFGDVESGSVVGTGSAFRWVGGPSYSSYGAIAIDNYANTSAQIHFKIRTLPANTIPDDTGLISLMDMVGSTNNYIQVNTKFGIGTSALPNAKLQSLSTTEQLRLNYDASNYASFTASLSGNLTIAPTGGTTAFTGSASVTGQFVGLGTATTATSNAIGYQAGTAGNIYHYRAAAGQDYINIRSSVANHETRIGIMPNGTFVPGTVNTQIAGFKIFGTDFTADETNNNDFGVYTTSNSNRFNSKHNGTGAALPFMWSLQDTQIMMNLDVNGYLGVGSPSSTAFTPNTRIFGNSNTSAPTTPDLTNSITIGVGNANATNKYLGQIGFLSADSDFTAPKMVAYIQAEATENYAGNTGVGSKMTFFTGTNLGTNPVARMQLDNLGNLILNNYTTQSGLLYVNNTTGTVAQTAQGAANTVLHGNGTGAPTFSSIVTADMANNAVTYGKMQAMTTNRLLGSGSGTAVSELAVSGTQGVSVAYGSGTMSIGLGAITPSSVNGVSAATMAFVDATSSIQTQLNAKQAALSGTGFVKASGGAISYDNSNYLTTSSTASTIVTKDIADSVAAFVVNQKQGTGFIQAWKYNSVEVAHIETDGTFVSNANLHASGNIEVSGHVQGGRFKLASLSAAPSSSSDTGDTGEFTFDSGYLYLCISTNNWIRAALTTF